MTREEAIKGLKVLAKDFSGYRPNEEMFNMAIEALEHLSSAQPEIKPIDYQDCSNAMLRMWMDNVVTDGEYNSIMDKLNAHWRDQNESD